MKKIKVNSLLIPFLFLAITANAQDFQGKAYYQTKRKLNIKIDDSKMNEQQKNAMQEMMKKQFEKTYILTFNKEESEYQQEQQLDQPTVPQSGGIQIRIIGGGTDQKLYKNTKMQSYTQEQNVFGKAFLIKDSLEFFNWKLENESKIIGKYLCFKATYKHEVEEMSLDFDGENKKKSNEVVQETKTQIITAWYTTDIPLNHGPDRFWGLPGLILELNDGEDMQYVCTKIIMNTKGEISEPTKGKIVSQEKYDEIMKKKMEEMMKNRGRQKRGSEGTFRISVGG